MKLINPSPLKIRHHASLYHGAKRAILSWLLVVLMFSCNGIAGENIQSIAQIRETAKIFLEEKQYSADNANVSIEIGEIDSRLRLINCDNQLEAFFPQQNKTRGRTTVGVRCLGTVGWKVYIAVEINEYQTVWVTTRNISKQELISKNDIRQSRQLAGYGRKLPIKNVDLIVNTSPRRNLRAGNVIYQDSVCLVCEGDKVLVNAGNEYINISMEGIALNDAALGEVTQIKNTKSRRVFGAKVVGKNQLTVLLSGR